MELKQALISELRARQKYAAIERNKKKGMDASNSISRDPSILMATNKQSTMLKNTFPMVKAEGGAAQTL